MVGAWQKNRWGMWDYLGDKKKGLGGELGTLNVNIALNSYEGGSFVVYLKDAYEVFLNGPNGSNTKIRQSEMGEDATDEELGDWIAYAPSGIEQRDVSGTNFLFWPQRNEQRGYEFIYYALPLNEKLFISFRFQYSANGSAEQEYSEHVSIIKEDIQTFMQRVMVFQRSK